jgi:hypothetical protein
MHSGNIGHAQNLDALVRAATFLRDLDDLTVVIIGGGARRSQLMATCTSSVSLGGSQGMWFRAGSMGSSRPGGP